MKIHRPYVFFFLFGFSSLILVLSASVVMQSFIKSLALHAEGWMFESGSRLIDSAVVAGVNVTGPRR